MMVIQDDVDTPVKPLKLAGCMIHIKHGLPNIEEVNALKQCSLTQVDTPWNQSLFSDKIAAKFYHSSLKRYS
jgi:hypothetical protein